MNTKPLSTKEKKLLNLRKILWIVFSAIAITILLVSSLSVPAALLINKTSNLSSLFVLPNRNDFNFPAGRSPGQNWCHRDHLPGDLLHFQISPGKG